MEQLSVLQKIRAFFVLAAWGLSILFVVGAPAEVQSVYSVKHAAPEKLIIDHIYLTSESCGVKRDCDRIQFEATKLSTGLPVESRIEVEPGVFHFGVSFQLEQSWSTKRRYLDVYQAGEIYDAYLASNGIYYLSQGSYFPFAYLLMFSVAWLLGNAIVIARGS